VVTILTHRNDSSSPHECAHFSAHGNVAFSPLEKSYFSGRRGPFSDNYLGQKVSMFSVLEYGESVSNLISWKWLEERSFSGLYPWKMPTFPESDPSCAMSCCAIPAELLQLETSSPWLELSSWCNQSTWAWNEVLSSWLPSFINWRWGDEGLIPVHLSGHWVPMCGTLKLMQQWDHLVIIVHLRSGSLGTDCTLDTKS
jgi:hypothetical protein